MRVLIVAAFLTGSLLAPPEASAQLRGEAPSAYAPAKLYDAGGSSFLMNKLFNPQNFRMGHSIEMTFGSFAGGTSSLAMYTNSLIWDFGEKLAARADIGVAYSPFQSGTAFGPNASTGPQVFLRNAVVAYRPRSNMLLHLSVSQSPYGRYLSPYGHYYGNRIR